MRAAEGAGRDQPAPLWQLPGNGVDLGSLHRLLPGQGRQNARQAFCQHGFAGAGRTRQQHVVPAGGRNDHGSPRQRLPHHVRKIRHLLPCVLRVKGDDSGRGERADALQRLHHLAGGMGRVDGHGAGAGLGCLGSVLCRDIQRPDAVLGGGKRHGQHAGYRAQAAVQRKLAQKGSVGGHLLQLAAGGKQCQKQRQVVYRTGLAHIGGGKVDGDAPVREAEAKVFDGGAYPVCAFPHGRVRQTYDGKRGQPAGNIGLHRNGKAAQPVQAKAVGHRIHSVPPCMAYKLYKMTKVGNNGCIYGTSTKFSV